MIVEAVGPTASGKSTVVAASVARLRERGIPVHTANEVVLGRWDARLPAAGAARAVAVQALTLPSLFAEVVARPGLAAYLVRLSVRHGERWSFRLNCARNALRRLAVARAVRKADGKRPSEVIVVDEGLAHFVDMLAESVRAPSTADVAEYARRVPLPDLLLRVRASPEVRASRILARGHRRLRQPTLEAVERYVRHGEAATDALLAQPALAGCVAVVDAGAGSDDLDRAVKQMTAAIEQALARQEDRGGRHADARP